MCGGCLSLPLFFFVVLEVEEDQRRIEGREDIHICRCVSVPVCVSVCVCV